MPVSARRQDAEFALPEVESKHEDDSIIGASSRDPFYDDRRACDGIAAAERGGPQAFHEGLPIQPVEDAAAAKSTRSEAHRLEAGRAIRPQRHTCVRVRLRVAGARRR